jgi:hypothetical protein
MIVTMEPALATIYAQFSSSERERFAEHVKAELAEAAPSAQLMGSINFSMRLIIEDGEIDRLRNGLKDRFLVETDYHLMMLWRVFKSAETIQRRSPSME